MLRCIMLGCIDVMILHEPEVVLYVSRFIIWLASRAGSLTWTKSFALIGYPSGHDIWVIDQACSVKMAGYWPSSLFACLWTETESRSTSKQKKNEDNIQPSYRTSLVNKGFIYGFRENFSCGTRRVALTGQNSSTLPARVANHSAEFDWLILPARGAGQIIRHYLAPQETCPPKPCSKSFIDQAWLDIGLVLFCMVMDLCNWNCCIVQLKSFVFMSHTMKMEISKWISILNYENCKPISVCGTHVILHSQCV